MFRRCAALAVAAAVVLNVAPATAQVAGAPTERLPQIGPEFPQLTPQEFADALRDAPATMGGDSGFFFDSQDPFYIPPAELPAGAGALIRSQDAPHPLNVVGPKLPGAAKKVLFTSTKDNGDPTVASASVIEPVRPWQGEGPTPTVVMAASTRGGGDVCAPSRASQLLAAVDTEQKSINFNYEIATAYAASALGARVIMADYIGLGTPGEHTYVKLIEEGRAVLDAARAGLKAVGAPVDSPIGIYGYSQGGGSAASAAEHASDYAPELNIKGTYAGAAPGDLHKVMTSVDGSGIVGVLGISIAGYSERDPEFAAEMDNLLNEKGKRFVKDNSTSCIVGNALKWAMTDSRTLTKTGESLPEAASRIPRIREAFAAEKLGVDSVTGPIMLSSSKVDDIIPNEQSRQLGRDFCNAGSEVYFREHSMPSWTFNLPLSLDHSRGMLLDMPESMNYLMDRFNNKPVPNSCGSI